MSAKKHNFGEKEVERIGTEEYEVWQSPKYLESRKKAVEMIDSEKYDLSDGDFWILMNKTKSGKMAYTGLIISHNGCLKINDNIEDKVKPNCFSIDKDGYQNSLVYTYCDENTYEVGEFNATNGKNAYPYAMAFKRCFDRVVLKKSKLAFSGIYSEVEASSFEQNIDDKLEVKAMLLEMLQKRVIETETDYEQLLKHYEVKRDIDLTIEQMQDAISILEKKGAK